MEAPTHTLTHLKYYLTILLTIIFLLHTLLTGNYFTHLINILTTNSIISLSCAWCVLLSIFYFYSSRPYPILLLNYSCYKPGPSQKGTYQASEDFVRRTKRFSGESEEFMRRIYLNSGLGDETYVPKFVFDPEFEAKLENSMEEARSGMFSAVESLLSKAKIDPARIDSLIVTCGGFSPVPSLSSLVVNRFKLNETIKTYNLNGMGCSSGVLAIDTASKLLRSSNRIGYSLVVIIETISANWYFGENRSMLVTNCIFRVGCAAVLLTNDPTRRKSAKMELVDSLRTHHGADDRSYRAAFQEEDENGNLGVSLTKDLVAVAGANLREHLRALAPRVLPAREVALYCLSEARRWWGGGGEKARVPDFAAALEHWCVHTGGKAVIGQIGKVMGLSDEKTEAARMTLHRFGNTSSSLVLYELAYFEAKKKVKKGDRMWMVAFGTGFKIGSLVWKAISNLDAPDFDNPWNDCISTYPLKSW